MKPSRRVRSDELRLIYNFECGAFLLDALRTAPNHTVPNGTAPQWSPFQALRAGLPSYSPSGTIQAHLLKRSSCSPLMKISQHLG